MNYYAKRNIERVMGWTDNNEFKFERLEHYFKIYMGVSSTGKTNRLTRQANKERMRK